MADESKRDHQCDFPSDPFPEQVKDTSIKDRQPEENLRFADAVNACELLRAQGRVEEAKAWSDRIVKEPITDKLLTALKVVGLRTGLTTIASRADCSDMNRSRNYKFQNLRDHL